jgi:hypothetical protein
MFLPVYSFNCPHHVLPCYCQQKPDSLIVRFSVERLQQQALQLALQQQTLQLALFYRCTMSFKLTAFDSDISFCPECGTILPLPATDDEFVVCFNKKCGYKMPVSGKCA